MSITDGYSDSAAQTVRSKARHILQLDDEQKREFLDSFDLVLSDCDGVIWMLAGTIPNTGSALMHLKGAGKQLKFISNNSMRSDAEYLTKLRDIGVAGIKESDLVHPVKTILRYIEKHKLRQPIYSLCSDQVKRVLTDNGISLVTMEPIANLTPDDLVSHVKPNDEVGAVIVDLHLNISFAELARAQQYLLAENCPLLVGASDILMPVSKNLVTIGPGGFVELLRVATGKQPIILGKPGVLLGEDLVELFALKGSERRALFIGDSLANDIHFGLDCGFQTLFVLSGACSMEEMLRLPVDSQPHYVANGLADFNEFFKSLS